jgi:flagellar motor switch protein FliM
MTSLSTDNLNPAVVSSLLTAIGSTKAEDGMVGEVSPFDWRHPRYFDQEQRNKIAAMMTQVAAVLSERFAHFYNQPFDVSVTSVAERFAGDMQDRITSKENICLAFGSSSNPTAGLLMVNTATAFSWVTLLLGDQDAPAAERALSALEQSLLSDLMTALVKAFLPLLGADKDMKPAAQFVKGLPGSPFEAAQEISTVVFQAKKANAETAKEITFVLPCSLLAPLAGKAIAAPPKGSADELPRLIMEHLQEMPVNVTAVLGRSALSFTEAVDLSPDDVLLLDKTVDVPIELRIDDRPVFWGHPAQCEGQYAVLVTAAAGVAKSVKPAAPEPTQNPPKQSKKG